MAGKPPKYVRIEPDDDHAKYVGRTAEGRQFFMTTPFVPAMGKDAGREFIAVYLFDKAGTLLEARIDDLGPRAQLDPEDAAERHDIRLAELGRISFGAIRVAPFEVQRFGVRFGLIPEPPEDEDDEAWSVITEPGNYMAFIPPWNGTYDT